MENRYKRNLTALAAQDINSATNYIAVNLSNSKAANDLLKKIRTTVDTICAFPRSFHDCKCYLINDENIRCVTVDNYILIYEILDNIKEINILRLVYAKMDLLNIEIK